MTNSFNSNQDFNELIFENKNKAYGAYELRSSEKSTVAKSMFITFIGVSLLVFTAFVSNKKSIEENTVIELDSLFSFVVDLREPLPDPVVPEQPKSPEKKAAYSDDINYKVEDKPVIDDLKVNDLLVLKKDGDKKGVIDSSEREVKVPVILPPSPPLPPAPPSLIVSEMPVLENMNKFIAENLHYPAIAVENGTSGTVFLSFVVEKDGSVTDVKVLRPIGDGCEEEAMRVVKMMPKWKPGKNHGELVRVQFNLPIRFKLQ